VYLGVPPLPTSVALYAAPVVPPGSELVTILSGAGAGVLAAATTIESDCEPACVEDPESVTLAVNAYVPVDPGVPAIWHVEAISTKPGGKVPEAREHAYGGVPPLAVTVALYAAPYVAPGSEVVVITKGGAEGARTVTVTGFEIRPYGFRTVTVAVPGFAMFVAGMEAWRFPLLTNIVVCLTPFHKIAEFCIKFWPEAVTRISADPAAMYAGFTA
jgi:hypothetical protein